VRPSRPELVLCSGSLGDVPLPVKIRAAAEAGFGWISMYGYEYDAAVAGGLDVASALHDAHLRVAEIDGVATSLFDPDAFGRALDIAVTVGARSVTIVETTSFNPTDLEQMGHATDAFAAACARAATHDVLVHLEPFAWSPLATTGDAATIITGAAQPNGGLLLDLWHHLRGPDAGNLHEAVDPTMLIGLQLADTVATRWANVRDECMQQRLLPGDGHGDLAGHVATLASLGPLPPVGVEVFGETLRRLEPTEGAVRCRAAVERTLAEAGL